MVVLGHALLGTMMGRHAWVAGVLLVVCVGFTVGPAWEALLARSRTALSLLIALTLGSWCLNAYEGVQRCAKPAAEASDVITALARQGARSGEEQGPVPVGVCSHPTLWYGIAARAAPGSRAEETRRDGDATWFRMVDADAE